MHKCKAVSVHTMKTYKGGRGIAFLSLPLMLNGGEWLASLPANIPQRNWYYICIFFSWSMYMVKIQDV
jgi:hypothetical protein